jgi:hypothetical protein
LSETFLTLRTERDMIKNVHWSSCKVLLVLMKLQFSRRIFEKTQVSNFMKTHLEGEELFHADRRTNRHEAANSTFSQFCECA